MGLLDLELVAALNFSRDQRRQQIIANLERWKWFPRNLGKEYIIVNIPDFKLRVVKENDTTGCIELLWGQLKEKHLSFPQHWIMLFLIRPGPFLPLSSKKILSRKLLKTKDIWQKKILWCMILLEMVISADNWNVDLASKYRYVQSPGISNSLGMVKLNFPNRFTVYLHDTNHRHFFDKDFRSLSSGCVRVENPIGLAEYLLDDRSQ